MLLGKPKNRHTGNYVVDLVNYFYFARKQKKHSPVNPALRSIGIPYGRIHLIRALCAHLPLGKGKAGTNRQTAI